MIKNCQTLTTPVMKYEAAAFHIKNIAECFLEKQGRELILDEEIKQLYRLLTLYFTDNPAFESYFFTSDKGNIPYSLNKGILLIGPPGRSKSFCFEHIFRVFTSKINPGKSYRILNSYMLQSAFEQEGIKALNNFRTGSRINSPDDLYIDEIGTEQLIVQHFGNKQNPVQSFLYERHRLFISSGFTVKTHASSNLILSSNNHSLKDFYGDRIYSRLFEMFNIIITRGDDLRICLK